MNVSELPTIARFAVDSLEVFVFENRALAGRAAAQGVAAEIAARQQTAGRVNLVFAAAPSQNEFLAGLVAHKEIDWSRVVAFHLDEYLGIDADHRVSFRRYLHEHLFRLVGLGADRLRLIPGEQVERPLRTCLDYEDILQAEPTDIVCAGIGENGHLAFNDPPADFQTDEPYLVVQLDEGCRKQQFGEGWFPTFADVPKEAISMSCRQIMKSRAIIVSVPDQRKAKAVQGAVEGPVTPDLPSSILQRHEQTTIYLDRDSASMLRAKQ